MRGLLHIYDDAGSLADGVAGMVSELLTSSADRHGNASFVLSGGGTPRRVYDILGSEEQRGRVPWSRVQIFWGDERCVGPNLPDSNYRMAYEAFLQKVAIPPANIHRIQGEKPPQEAARLYEAEIRQALQVREGEFPRFTVLLLGLGPDGHTASLFPGTLALQERKRIVTEVYVESLKASRITLTIPAINNSVNVLFLVSGRSKSEMLGRILLDEGPLYPAQFIDPANGRLHWCIDREASLHT